MNPTLFTGVKNGMTIAQQEIFGPVASVIEFNGVEEAICHLGLLRLGLALRHRPILTRTHACAGVYA